MDTGTKVKFGVVGLKQSDGSYFVACPELALCYTQGDTIEDAMDRLRELVNEEVSRTYEDFDDYPAEKEYFFTTILADTDACKSQQARLGA